MSKKALITGITGQDGSYLAELLLNKGYEVHGIVRRASTFNRGRIDHLFSDEQGSGIHTELHYGDLGDGNSLIRILSAVKPDEIYNLAAQSHVAISFDIPEYTGDVTGIGAARLLEAVRSLNLGSKIYQASSSELYGKVVETPQSETTPFHPRSPYGCAKAYAFYMMQNYRESYGMFAVNGILFNHESPRRGETFVTRKITMAAARIKLGLQEKLHLGNLSAKRDWGFAGDYVNAMWLMLQQENPDDYVIATGETHSVQEWLDTVFAAAGLSIEGNVEIDERLFRPHEVPLLLGDPSKAKQKMGWEPKIKFGDLASLMYHHDFDMAKKELVMKGRMIEPEALIDGYKMKYKKS